MAGFAFAAASLAAYAAQDARFAFEAARVTLDDASGRVTAAGFRHALAEASVITAEAASFHGNGGRAPYAIEMRGLRISGSDPATGGLSADAGVFYPHLRTLSTDRLLRLGASADTPDRAPDAAAGWTCEDGSARWSGEPLSADQACVATGAAAFAIRCQADGSGVDVVVVDACAATP